MVSWLQLVAGVAWLVPLWVLGLRERPVVSPGFVGKKFGPIALLHATGHAAQVAALGKGSVFMVAVVKASEPIVGTVVGFLGTGQIASRMTNLSLLPIVVGITIAASKPGARLSASDLATASSLAALVSTVVFAMAKLLAKRLMTPEIKRTRKIGAANNYALLTCCSTLVLAAPALLIDAPRALPAFRALDQPSRLATRILVSGLAYYASNECSFQVLDLLGPVEQAVANAAKRVFVFAAAVLFLGEHLTPTKLAGSALALAGVLCYSLSKARPPPKAD